MMWTAPGLDDTSRDLSGQTFLDSSGGIFRLSLRDLFAAVYDARLLIQVGADTIPSVVPIGDLNAAVSEELVLDLLVDDLISVAVIGASAPGGRGLSMAASGR